MRRKGRIALGLAASVAALAVLTVAFYPADRLRPELEARLSAATGLPVRLGQLSVSVLGGIGVRADGLQVGPRAGRAGGRRTTLSAGVARIRLSVGALLRGRTAMRGIDLRQAELSDSGGVLLTDARGRTEFSTAADGILQLAGSFDGRPPGFGEDERLTGSFRVQLVEDRIELSELDCRFAGAAFRGKGIVDGVRAGSPRVQISGKGFAGETSGAGSLAASISAHGTDVEIDAKFANLLTNDLTPIFALARASKPAPSGGEGAVSRSAPAALRVVGRLQADRARFGSLELRNLRSGMAFDGRRFDLPGAEFELYGGTGTGRVSLDLELRKRPFVLESRGDRIDVKRLQEALAPGGPAVIEGTASFDLRLSGEAPSARVDRSSLAGTLGLEVANGRIASLGVLAQVSALAARLEQRDVPADTRFEELTGDVRIEGGNAQVERLILRSEEVNLDGRGRIALDGAVDLDVTASLAPGLTASLQERAPSLRHWIGPDRRLSVPLRLAGTMRDPRVSMDIDQAASEGLARFLEGKGRQGTLRKLLGGR